MDYGMGPYGELDYKDFTFKPEGRFYFDEKPVKPNYRIGLPKWGDMLTIINEKEGVKNGIKEKDCLKEYAKRFNAIELNATHYKIYDETGVKKWVDDVDGKDFKFCPKMYKGITHFGSLKGKDVMLKEFCDSIKHFGDHLGPVFISLSPNFSPRRKEELYQFLRTLPVNEINFLLELRNEEWYSNASLKDELTEILLQLGSGIVILDTPLIRTGVHFNFLQPSAFIRFACEGNNDLDVYRIQQWKQQLVYLSNHGVQDIYFFLHIHDKNKIEEFYEYVQSELLPAQNLLV